MESAPTSNTKTTDRTKGTEAEPVLTLRKTHTTFLSHKATGLTKGFSDSSLSHFDTSECILDIQNATFTVPTKSGKRNIVDDISFPVKSAEPCAMMGPSGAGKTSLLEFLTLSLKGPAGSISGKVALDGRPFDEVLFRKHAAFVEQYDNHRGFLTCRETFRFSSRLCIVNKEEAERRVESLLEKLGLRDCADTKAGNAFLKGMSGGQKKRLSVGLALLKGPKVLFLDEPTSGLDAASAEKVMTYVDITAKETNMVTVFTIHQPATKVFMNFATVVVLANGRLAYCGPPAEMSDFCKTIGREVPPMTNPADHFLEIVNSEFNERSQVDGIVNAWQSTHKAVPHVAANNDALKHDLDVPGTCALCCVVARRELLLAVRDPTRYVGRCLAFIVSGTFFSIVYLKARERNQESVQPLVFLMIWVLGPPAMLGIINVVCCNENLKLARKEVKNGMGSLSSHLITENLLPIPFLIILAVAELIPAFAISAWHPGGVPKILLIVFFHLFVFEAMAAFWAMVAESFLVGMFGYVLTWLMCFLFGGLFLDQDDIIYPFKVLPYILPLRYTTRSIAHVEYSQDRTWGSARWTVVGGSPKLGCDNPFHCYGVTGPEVLKSMNQKFSLLSPEETLGEDILVLLAIGMFFRVAAIVLAVVKHVRHV